AEVEQKMSVYDALVDAVEKTDTKVKSPELMEIAAAVRAGNEQLYIHWDAIKKLYGDKIPEPGDGLLGDVPGMVEQFRNAVDTATDIQVPLATWLSKIDSDIVKELHDDIRFRPGDPTLNEVKTFPKLEQAVQAFAKPSEVGKAPLEELVTTPPGATEAPIDRMLRLRVEYADRLATHGALEHAPTPEGNLLLSLAAVTGRTFEADKVSNATRWAYLNERPDIVDRALELAKLSDPQLHSRLETELSNLNRYADAQNAIKRETAQKPLGWDTADTSVNWPTWGELLKSPEWKKIGELTGVKAHGDLTEAEALVRRGVAALFEQMAGPGTGVKLLAAREIRMGLEEPTSVRGAYVMPGRRNIYDPTIAFLLAGTNPIATLGHEFMHHLRRYRFLKESEWAVLERMSREQWIDEHNTRGRYPEAGDELLAEEGVTSAFGKGL